MSPARTTISTAVARKTGSGAHEASARRRRRFDHPDFHAALGRRLQRHFVHVVADEEDAAAAGLQDVLGRERIGDVFGVEARPWSLHARPSCRSLGSTG